MSKTSDDAELAAFLEMRDAHFKLLESFSFENAKVLRAAVKRFMNFYAKPSDRINFRLSLCPPPGNDNDGNDSGSAA